MDVRTQTFLILGVSKSGLSSAEYILKKGGNCYFYEEGEGARIKKAQERITELGGIRVDENDVENAIEKSDAVVISPGVPINHRVAVLAKEKGKTIIGELELGYTACLPRFIAVTGTNGKTTTVSLLKDIFTEAGENCSAVGNVGVPLTSALPVTETDTTFITEVSSFQLESVKTFRPHVSCIINIAPDHLERHYTMENYVFLKKRIFANQKNTEYCVLNFDDETVRSFEKEVKANVVWVSCREKVDGAYFENGSFYYKGEKIADRTDLPIDGEHNVYNALFSIAVSKICKIRASAIKNGFTGFKGAPYRMQLVSEKGGIRFINDSKSTNTASAITAIRATSTPAILILGGSEKGEDYKRLFSEIKGSSVRHTVLTGASRRNMLQAADSVGYDNITVCEDFDFAVKIAEMMAVSGETVLFSPACASFDKFGGYEERGERFNRIIAEKNVDE